MSAEAFARLARHFRDPASWAVYDDVAPTLDRLDAGGLRLAVVSNWDSHLPDPPRGSRTLGAIRRRPRLGDRGDREARSGDLPPGLRAARRASVRSAARRGFPARGLRRRARSGARRPAARPFRPARREGGPRPAPDRGRRPARRLGRLRAERNPAAPPGTLLSCRPFERFRQALPHQIARRDPRGRGSERASVEARARADRADLARHRRGGGSRHLRGHRDGRGRRRESPGGRAGARHLDPHHGDRLRLLRALLRGVRRARADLGERLHLLGRDAGRARRVDHRVGPHHRIRHGQRGGRRLVVRLFLRAPEGLRDRRARLAADGPDDRDQDAGLPGFRPARRRESRSSSTCRPSRSSPS